MEHIKRDFSLKAWVLSPGIWPRPKLNFLEYGHVAYPIKGNDTYSNMVANILHADTRHTLDP